MVDEEINDEIKRPKGYLGNQFGFSQTGEYLLDNLIKPRLAEMDFDLLDPFFECGMVLDLDHASSLERYDDRMAYFKEFSAKVPLINNDLIVESDFMMAILDGGHIVDDGTASEIGFFYGVHDGNHPIFALRTDWRLGENMSVTINPQILGYIVHSEGALCSSLDDWFMAIQNWVDKFGG